MPQVDYISGPRATAGHHFSSAASTEGVQPKARIVSPGVGGLYASLSLTSPLPRPRTDSKPNIHPPLGPPAAHSPGSGARFPASSRCSPSARAPLCLSASTRATQRCGERSSWDHRTRPTRPAASSLTSTSLQTTLRCRLKSNSRPREEAGSASTLTCTMMAS